MKEPTKKKLLSKVSEKSFQAQVIALAQARGWTVAHFRSVRQLRRDGTVRYLTPVQADGAGFPDLVMVRRGVIYFAELKSMSGKSKPGQDTWLTLLDGADATVSYLWKPSDWEEIEEALE